MKFEVAISVLPAHRLVMVREAGSSLQAMLDAIQEPSAVTFLAGSGLQGLVISALPVREKVELTITGARKAPESGEGSLLAA